MKKVSFNNTLQPMYAYTYYDKRYDTYPEYRNVFKKYIKIILDYFDLHEDFIYHDIIFDFFRSNEKNDSKFNIVYDFKNKLGLNNEEIGINDFDINLIEVLGKYYREFCIIRKLLKK